MTDDPEHKQKTMRAYLQEWKWLSQIKMENELRSLASALKYAREENQELREENEELRSQVKNLEEQLRDQ